MVVLYTAIFKTLWAAFMGGLFNVYVLEGGSRSSKTYSIIQFLIRYAYQNKGKNKRVIISRLKSTWIKTTVLKDFIDILKSYGLYDKKNFNKTDRIYKLYDTEFWFIGLDDEQKIHGMKSDVFWINEAIEASFNHYSQLMQRCSGFGILDYNPSEEEHWIYDKVCKRSKTFYHHSTMLQNPLIPKTAKEQILSYEPTDENYKNGTVDKRKWAIYGLGKRAALEGQIFTNGFEEIEDIPVWVKRRLTGIDFGYTNDVTAIPLVGLHDNSIYIDELCYRTHMKSSDIIKKLKEVNENRNIWSESADPRLIDEIMLGTGFNIRPVQKGPGSVKASIDKIKTMKVYITSRSLNAMKEWRNYVYQQDKNGKWLDEPVDTDNHIIDAVRYVILMELLGTKLERNKNLGSTFR